MSQHGQRLYELVVLAVNEGQAASVIQNKDILTYLVNEKVGVFNDQSRSFVKDDPQVIDGKVQTLESALRSLQTEQSQFLTYAQSALQLFGTISTSSTATTAGQLVQGLINKNSVWETYIYQFAASISQKSSNNTSLTFDELKFVFAFESELKSALASEYFNIFGTTDYYNEFFEKLRENQSLIPLGNILPSFNEFDVDVSTFIINSQAASFPVDQLHFAGLTGVNYFLKQADGSAIGENVTGIAADEWDKMLAAKPDELTPLLTTSGNVNPSDLLGDTNISNASSFGEQAREEVLNGWISVLRQQLTENFRSGGNIDDVYNQAQLETSQKVLPIVLRTLENSRRLGLWQQIGGRAAADIEDSEDLLANANAAATASLLDSGLAGGLAREDLSDQQIKERQRFYQQCVLMAKMNDLKSNFEVNIGTEENPKTFHSSGQGVYSQRFYMVKSDDNGSFVNSVLASKGESIKHFLSITPDIQAFLVPKIRIYKVYETKEGTLSQLEFPFPGSSVENLKMNELFADNTKPFRGGGFGIKSFSFSFDGTTPATARNDITAKLSLFFQDFSDFVKVNKTKNSKGQFEDFRFVDMMLFDTSKAYENPKVRYDPSYYRIRADVGWVIPDENNLQFKKACEDRKLDPDLITNVLRESNKTFYLNMVEHSINFTDEGAVNIDIDYRAYIESALKGSKLDALSSPEILTRRAEREQNLSDAYASGCTQEQIARLKRLYAAEQEEELKAVYRRILTDLEGYKKIYSVEVTDDGGYRKNGFFEKAPVLNLRPKVVTEANSQLPTEESKSKPKEQSIPTEFVSSDPDNTVQFFYLGDLFFLALDSLFWDQQKKVKNTRFILPSITIEDFFDTSLKFDINLAQIPISVRYFAEWYNEFVIKPEIKSYAIMYFIRDLLNNLLTDTLIDVCLNRDYDKSFVFTTMTALNYKNAFENLSGYPNTSNAPGPIIDLNNHVGSTKSNGQAQKSIFPFVTDPKDLGADVDINDIYNFIFIVPQYNSITNLGTGNYSQDLDRGVLHFEIGLDRGLLKSAKFNKTDMQYIREARFFQNQGVDGLLQLAAVYSVDLKLFGNCLLYPGMEIFVNPFSLGGEDFVPNVQGSIANKLGLGGYHLVTRVSSEITPGSFNTNVKALFVYSGDGATTIYKNGLGLVTESSPEEQDQTTEQKQQCSTTYSKEFQTYKDIVESGTFNAAITIETIDRPTNSGASPSSQATPPVNQPATNQPAITQSEAGGIQSTGDQPIGTVENDNGEKLPYFRYEIKGNTIIYYDENNNQIYEKEGK